MTNPLPFPISPLVPFLRPLEALFYEIDYRYDYPPYDWNRRPGMGFGMGMEFNQYDPGTETRIIPDSASTTTKEAKYVPLGEPSYSKWVSPFDLPEEGDAEPDQWVLPFED
jgi:hypothetical protein